VIVINLKPVVPGSGKPHTSIPGQRVQETVGNYQGDRLALNVYAAINIVLEKAFCAMVIREENVHNNGTHSSHSFLIK
jgi:hypothetical protein